MDFCDVQPGKLNFTKIGRCDVASDKLKNVNCGKVACHYLLVVIRLLMFGIVKCL